MTNEPPKPLPEVRQQALHWIGMTMNSSMTIDGLADLLGVSRTRLQRALEPDSFSTLRTAMRMQAAAEMLKLRGKHALTTAQIAKNVGYTNRAAFSRAFTKHFSRNGERVTPEVMRGRGRGRRQAVGERRRRGQLTPEQRAYRDARRALTADTARLVKLAWREFRAEGVHSASIAELTARCSEIAARERARERAARRARTAAARDAGRRRALKRRIDT